MMLRNKLLLLGAACLLGWLAGAPASEQPSTVVEARRDGWQLPALRSMGDTAGRAAIVATFPQWGVDKPTAAASAPEEVIRWRVAGIYGRGKSGGVLILYEADRKPAERVRVGEKLPSGHVLELIDGNQVYARLGKKRESFGVEHRE